MDRERKLTAIAPHVEVEVWRLQQLANRIKDASMKRRAERLARNLLPGQKLWISGELYKKLEESANAPQGDAADEDV